MNKRISMGLCISLIILSVTATFAITMVTSKQIYNTIINNLALRSQISDTVDEIEKIISINFYGNVEDKNSLITNSLVEGYVDGLGDGSSRYLTAAQYDEYLARLENGYMGIGIETAFNSQASQLLVSYVYEGSPAQAAGLKKDDIITAIGDTAVSEYNYETLTQKLFGAEKLSSIKLSYLRGEKEGTAEPMLGFAVPSVTGRMIGETGYIRITAFYKNTADLLAKQVEALRVAGAVSFIFDVRNTSEGTIEYAAAAVDAVVSTNEGNIAVLRTKGGDIYKDTKYVASVSKVTEPVVVLVNSNTASGAELFACDLRDMRNARLVGTTTKGVGTMQDIFTLENGGAILLTVALVEPNKGERAIYNEVGVEPAYIVPLKQTDYANLYLLADGDDAQLQKALELLTAQ